MSTKLPLAAGNHARNAALSVTSGRMITFPSTRPFVGALQASIIASSERTRGDTRSKWVIPRRQLRQVPYCSFFALIPHA